VRLKGARLGTAVFLPAALALGAPAALGGEYTISASSYLGDASDADAVRGAGIQPDGKVVLAANIGSAEPGGVASANLNGATASSGGAVVRLSPDGTRVLSVTRVGAEVTDLALAPDGTIYVAAGTGGLVRLGPDGAPVVWSTVPASGAARRVDVGSDGTSAVLAGGRVLVHDSKGSLLGEFATVEMTEDVCVDGASKTVAFCHWRNAHALGNPVQIAGIRGMTYDGRQKWKDYGWSSDDLNRPENNMADTRAYRCAVGADGKLYCAFECAGGNHQFRYDPQDVMTKVRIVGGDKYHEFYNTKSEHKTFFGRYDPATGAYLLGQQFTCRLSSGSGNTVRTKDGAIFADSLGRVYLGGASAYGLPMSFTPPGTGDYTGGAWFLVMSRDFTTRLYCTRLNVGGTTHAVAARVLPDGRTAVAWAGRAKDGNPLYVKSALQPAAAGGTQDGFFAVVGAVTRAALDGSIRARRDPAGQVDDASVRALVRAYRVR
jgi:hypothetical protein